MARVYLDASALYLHWSDAFGAIPVPDAESAVELLEADGHDVFMVGAKPAAGVSWEARLPRVDEPTPSLANEPRAWLVVGDRARCGPSRSGLTTVLVGGGPSLPAGGGRCDNEVIDLQRAVLAIIGGASIT